MTTKERAYLKSLAMTMEPIFQVGKSSMTPGLTQAISEALEARELIMFRSLGRKLYCIGKEKITKRRFLFLSEKPIH